MAPPVLSLREVRLADGRMQLFDGVNLGLETGVRACLVGRNGAGKSTLLRMLVGSLAPDDGERIARPGLKIALVAQEPAVTGATLEAYAQAGGAARHETQAALESFGLDPSRSTAGLSGGEARRAALAKAFAEAPDVLLLDEPTNHLDIMAIESLEARLHRTRVALLVVSHDRRFLERITHRCYWLDERRVRRLDKGFAAFEPWAETIVAAAAEADRRLDKAIEREERWLAYGVTGRRARNEGRRRRLNAMRADKSRRLAQARGELNLPAGAPPASGRLAIEVKDIAKGFPGRPLIAGFSTRVLAGDKVAIVGPNGAGKTTLLRLLLAQETADRGQVRLGTGLEMAYVSQDRAELDPTQSLLEALTPSGGDQIMVQGRPRHVAGYAADFGFRSAQLRQPVAALSGGERNRLLLARALAKPSNLLVLDEPTNDLDMDTLDLLEELLADYEGTMLLVSHDRDFVDRLATSTIALNGTGKVVETPGGWTDFVAQNPGFFESGTAPSEGRSKPAPPRARQTPSKLSYKDERRLAELESLLPALASQRAEAERLLADPGLYERDQAAFEAAMRRLDELGAAIAAAEDDWLELESKRELTFAQNLRGREP